MAAHTENALKGALLSYSRESIIPNEFVSSTKVIASALPEALQGLESAKFELENNIRDISRDVAPNVDSWITHAKRVQSDIEKSKKLANDIVRQAEKDAERAEAMNNTETYLAFLQKELDFSLQLGESLHLLQQATVVLEQTESFISEQLPSEALRSLENIEPILSHVPVTQDVRITSVILAKASDSRDIIHQQIKSHWNSAVEFKLTELQLILHKPNSALEEIITIWQAFDSVDTITRNIWQKINGTFICPCMASSRDEVTIIRTKMNRLYATTEKNMLSLELLLANLESVIDFTAKHFPGIVVQPLSELMIESMFHSMKTTWLHDAIPVALEHMIDYQGALTNISKFATGIESRNLPGAQNFREWASNAPKHWLNKKREVCLDQVRNNMAKSLNVPKQASHVEERAIDPVEGPHVGPPDESIDEWDIGWGSGEEDVVAGLDANIRSDHKADEGGADAWGWGDDDEHQNLDSPRASSPSILKATKTPVQPKLPNTPPRRVTLTENYTRTSLPEMVVSIVKDLFSDTQALSQDNMEFISVAAGGLMAVTPLVLAEFRAVSPIYYETSPLGLMFAYNDSLWLCDEFKTIQSDWIRRDDASPRVIQGLQKLDPEIRCLQSFGRRAYGKEMDAQRLLLRDLLGGSHNFIQQDNADSEASTEAVINHVKQLSSQWEKILRNSSWRFAIGSLVDTIAQKIISDVFDMSDMSVDEAESTARLISKITSLESLFTDRLEREDDESQPLMAEYAGQWLRLQFLSEVLQSNLNDIKWLWVDSELSMHFSKEEVVDLIHLSFENNAMVRSMVKEIKEKPLQEK